MMSGDQAGALRDLVARRKADDFKGDKLSCPSIAVTSGKGGVGKSTLSVLLARALAAQGEKVLLFDGDMGLANLHILMGISTPFTLKDYLIGKVELGQCVYPVSENIDLLPGVSGDAGLANISRGDLTSLLVRMNSVIDEYDRLIVDGGAGIAETSLSLTLAADQVLVIITPDPTSLADAYATIKVLASRGCREFNVVVNMTDSEDEGVGVEEKLTLLTEKFLGITPQFLGRLQRNRKLGTMIREERSVLLAKGMGDVINRMNGISRGVAGKNIVDGNGFFNKLLTVLSGESK